MIDYKSVNNAWLTSDVFTDSGILGIPSKSGARMTLVENGESEYKICYAGTRYDIYYDGAIAVRSTIKQLTGVELPLEEKKDSDTQKIIYICGDDSLKQDSFSVNVSDSVVKIAGSTRTACVWGVYYISRFVWGYDALRDIDVPKIMKLTIPSKLSKTMKIMPNGEATIAGRKLSDFRIVIPALKRYESEGYAAKLITNAIEDMCGGAIVETMSDNEDIEDKNGLILIGHTSIEEELGFNIDRDKMPAGGIAVKVNGTNVLVTGKTSDQVVAAAYALLEDCLDFHDLGFMPKLPERNVNLRNGFKFSGKSALRVVDSLEFDVESLTKSTVATVGEEICFSDQDTIDDLVDKLSDIADDNDTIYAILNAKIKWCDCPECRAAAERTGTKAGAFFEALNKAADDLYDYKIVTLASRDTLKAPKMELAENIDVVVCDDQLCSSHGVNDKNCASNKNFAKTVKEWLEVTENVYILDLTSDYHHYPITFPNWNVIYDNFKYYLKSGVKAVYLQIYGKGSVQTLTEMRGLREYLYRRLCRNPKATREEFEGFINDYLGYAFGKAASYIGSYMKKVEEVTADKCYNIYTPAESLMPLEKVGDWYDLGYCSEMFDLWDAITPYTEAVDKTKSMLGHMILRRISEFNRADNAMHAKTQFTLWLQKVVNNKNRTLVIRSLLGELAR